MGTPGRPPSSAEHPLAESNHALIEARGLCWQTPDGRPVLRDVSFALHPGDRLALRGPSGCGKSTLLRSLVLLEPSSGGTIAWRGEPVTPRTVLALRQAVRWCAQRPVPVAGTVGEDLALARRAAGGRAAPPAQVDALLERLGLSHLSAAQPVDRLSGGELQRFALVRALAGGPDVLLLDEPTSALDAAAARDVEAVVRDWLDASPDRAMVWVSHDAHQAARLCTRDLVLGAA